MLHFVCQIFFKLAYLSSLQGLSTTLAQLPDVAANAPSSSSHNQASTCVLGAPQLNDSACAATSQPRNMPSSVPSSSSSIHVESGPLGPRPMFVLPPLARHHRPPRMKGLYLPAPPPVFILPGRQRLAQDPSATSRHHHHPPAGGPGIFDYEDEFQINNEVVSPSGKSALQKREIQWQWWSQDVIPALLNPYLQYLEASESLHVVVDSRVDHLTQCLTCVVHPLTICCLFFNRLEEIKISYCACTPAPVHLMESGLFACSPVAPTLAVDLRVLEFMRTLFVRLTPNTTAWCEALESFLDGQGYQLQSKDNLRRWFSNAYHWYTALATYADDHITGLVHPPQASMQQGVRLQPSEYLCARCPLCFGGVPQKANTDQEDLDCIVCLDACFTQKRTNNPRNSATHDPPNPTSTVFIPESEVKAMEVFIGKQRSLAPGHHDSSHQLQGDSFEDGMRVPMSVLDGCGDSFHAADENQKKASTNFFADTGLMALLCRHDHVLWLVNMTSAGEKQHYALVLLKYLFEHLPTTTTVGLLYDIGCQLERSCHKWKLLDEGILSRLKFGISVFHAYGHQWPCQIVYHPRKCVGFGLSDVSGYHQRLFVLDNQIRHFDRKAFAALGQWLNKKWTLCKSKKILFERSGLPRYTHRLNHYPSKNKGANLLAHILSLEKSVQDYQSHVDQLEMDLVNDRVNDIIDFDLQCAAAKSLLSKATKALQQKKSALGVSSQTDLYLLRNNKEHLRQRKFELQRLEGSFQNSANDNHLQSHVQSAIKRREPAISQLITTYNNLCDELLGMIRLQKAPPGAIPHLPIPTKGIFQLDVDSNIWQDCEPGEGSSEPPQWLADEAVHKGIRLMLEVDRCNEEERRLSRERSVLQEWFSMEWKSLHRALENEAENYKYHLKAHKHTLLAVYVDWKEKVQHIPHAWVPSENWGLTVEDVANYLAPASHTPSVEDGAEHPTDDFSEGYESDAVGALSEGDDELLLGIEEMALEEGCNMGQSDEEGLTDDEGWLEDVALQAFHNFSTENMLEKWREEILFFLDNMSEKMQI
ncbi:hypothetical protein EV401DRAFT_2080701 [Pisolithus croceorrhizus]|nr:hypothetical protein EV401DRAFT_2080701 [Pisolithus croceorrhizus]